MLRPNAQAVNFRKSHFSCWLLRGHGSCCVIGRFCLALIGPTGQAVCRATDTASADLEHGCNHRRANTLALHQFLRYPEPRLAVQLRPSFRPTASRRESTSVSLGIHEFASVDFTDAVNCILPGAAGVPHSARKYVAELATLRDLGGLVTHPFSACRKPQFARSFSAVPRLISPALPFTSTACSAWIYEQHDASLCAPAFGPCSSAWLPVARQFPARSSQAFRM